MSVRPTGSRLFPAYLRPRGIVPDYSVEADGVIVAERDHAYTLYRIGVTASDGSRHRHLLIVPTNVGAVSFDVGLALVEADSVAADAGRFARIERLAGAVRWDYRRYRCFPPPPSLNRFCL